MNSPPHPKQEPNADPTVNNMQPINGAVEVEAESSGKRSQENNGDIALESEHSSKDSLRAEKRVSVEPCEQSEPKRKRVKQSPASSSTNGVNTYAVKESSESIEPPEVITKETWQGFCEIESEPAFFSTILRDMGVQGINVQEVFAMYPEFLETLPRPIYGLVLLYRYRENGSSEQLQESSSDVWFANQLPAQNSCATLAMINILMNNNDIEIGEHLREFKEFTKDFTPYQRGEAIASFDFIKRIHNSFAKEMDILEADKHLSYKVKKAQSQLRDKKSRRKSTDSATNDSAEDSEDNAHHFIAYIPVGDEVWMLDGLNAQPMHIAKFDKEQGRDWVAVAADSILAILASGGDDYTGFAIMPSPLPSLRKQACLATNHVQQTESRLDETSPDWRSSLFDDEPPRTLPQTLGIEDQLPKCPVPDALAETIASEETKDLLERRTRVLKDLESLAENIKAEMRSEAEDARKAAQGRFDHAPVIKLWAEMLAENGYLEQNLDRFIGAKNGSKKAKK
ncbi:ubiquitin carboxyl-terminal hydrolase [Boeremia exigua]|uniref:ubiquitin carboxyl-terminal hydrolase n=1 Tax=Boeremia exigua TaxID=749465 RepID=UPI001E8D3B47|nr:ubiquitin carboxyl-terminal hydrolase [Boeremia exigua]KAH6637616.1 ubiquitin carboxyl-terminal hydrolase [Boeremia exigua]